MKLIIANWKMYLSIGESVALAKKFLDKLQKSKNEVVICPSFVALQTVYEVIKKNGIYLGAQDCGWGDEGAFTGEVSSKDLKQLGCKYVIIGHSERRHLMNESEELVNKKMITAMKSGLKPILCVGETAEERREGEAAKVVKRQLKSAFAGLPINSKPDIVLAYEPVWAIGTGIAAKPEDALTMHKIIREFVLKLVPKGSKLRILYGGSVTSKNTAEFLKEKEIDGFLVGGASARMDFVEIANH